MPSHMSVQTFATERNSQVEFLVQFILEKFCEELVRKKLVREVQIVSQQHYSSPIASDVWDHFITAIQHNGRQLELWCQTTCYKGNETGSPEANKTYEIRETLVEAISIREHVDVKNNVDVRTIHFTVGDRKYTYQWFLSLKAASFDHSSYIWKKGTDLFQLLSTKLNGLVSENDKRKKLQASFDADDNLGKIVKSAQADLLSWFVDAGMPESNLAELQGQLVKNELKKTKDALPNLSKIVGSDIKGRANNLLFGADLGGDPLLVKTVTKILDKKPFLANAINVLSDWDAFRRKISLISDGSKSLGEYLPSLWAASHPLFLMTRRILLRIHSEEGVSYIQDRNIAGISEHNLYNAPHSVLQTRLICEQIEKDLLLSGINTPAKLTSEIFRRGKHIINEARWFEAKNGTTLKPSFEYVELALISAGYDVVSATKAKCNVVGYHAQISSENVKPYVNQKFVLDKNGNPLCLLKAKFFREQEFPRRCKEEAFVGLSLKYGFDGKAFYRKIPYPLVMFVDMAKDCTPPEYAVRRLMAFGWDIAFSIDDLLKMLKKMGKK